MLPSASQRLVPRRDQSCCSSSPSQQPLEVPCSVLKSGPGRVAKHACSMHLCTSSIGLLSHGPTRRFSHTLIDSACVLVCLKTRLASSVKGSPGIHSRAWQTEHLRDYKAVSADGIPV